MAGAGSGLSRKIQAGLIVHVRKVPLSWEDCSCLESCPHQFRRHFPSDDYRVPAQDHDVRRRLGRRQVLIRADSGGGTHQFLSLLSRPGRRLSYSIGLTLTEEVQQAILALPEQAWTLATMPRARYAPVPGWPS
ncbi:hypothetical protein FLW16_40365 [Microbispora sp. KK1-11]|nr:hypothetical protein FLW16_40365 [Microbispora sp. KK1-11]